MANFRTTADYLDSILLLAGETTNGNSAFEARALHYLNRIHNSIIAGGNEFNVEVDELWDWMLEPEPMFIELQPKYIAGTVALTNGSATGAFSAAPSISLEGYHIKPTGKDAVYKILQHTAAATAFKLDSAFAADTNGAATYEAYKLDYELVPEYITINSFNNKIVFTEATAGTQLTATLDSDVYTIAELLVEIKTQLDSAGASIYTVIYSSTERKFSITSDLGGADNLFSILGATADEASIYESALPTLGLGLKDHTGLAVYKSERALGSISKLGAPMRLHSGYADYGDIGKIDKNRFNKDYPISAIYEGNADRFTIIEERDDGYVKVRFNKFPKEIRRVEVDYILNPLNLYDNSNSHPLIPRKYSQLLEYGGAAYLMGEKNDTRAPQYFQLAGQVLEAMMKNQRKSDTRTGRHFGEVVAREDLLSNKRKKRLIYGTPDNS